MMNKPVLIAHWYKHHNINISTIASGNYQLMSWYSSKLIVSNVTHSFSGRFASSKSIPLRMLKHSLVTSFIPCHVLVASFAICQNLDQHLIHKTHYHHLTIHFSSIQAPYESFLFHYFTHSVFCLTTIGVFCIWPSRMKSKSV